MLKKKYMCETILYSHQVMILHQITPNCRQTTANIHIIRIPDRRKRKNVEKKSTRTHSNCLLVPNKEKKHTHTHLTGSYNSGGNWADVHKT